MIRDAVDKYHVDVINVSIGIASETEELRAAVAYVQEQGVSIVAAAGNSGSNSQTLYPAACDSVIGVGSVDKHNEVSDFSPTSPAVMLVAPGEDFWMASRDGKRFGAKGTSYAAAQVSGAIARLLEQNPELTPEEIRSILCESALNLCEEGYDEQSGYGILQLEDALEIAAVLPQMAH